MLIETQIPGITDHGLMAGLGDDDHTQYLLADGSRSADAINVGASGECALYVSGGQVHLYADVGDIYLDVTSCLYVAGDIYLNGTEFSLGYDGLRIRQNGTTYAAEYDSWDKNEHYFQYQGTNLFAVKSTGIYIYGSSDYANMKFNGSDFEIWGGMGDIVIYPYDQTVIHYPYCPDGIAFTALGNSAIYDSSGDLVFEASGGFYFDSSYPLMCSAGYYSSQGNPGATETVSTSGGDCYFEDGLLVYVSVY